MPSRWTNQPISLFGNLVFLNRDDSYGACAVGPPVGRFKVDSHEFHCNGLLKIEFFTRHREAAKPPARRRSIFPHLQLLHHQEKTRGGNCVSQRTHICPDRSRCCFNSLSWHWLSRARARHWSPRMSRTPHFSTVRIDTTFVGFPATRPLTCPAQRSNAARRSGSSSLLL
jgi:hypothetical protein